MTTQTPLVVPYSGTQQPAVLLYPATRQQTSLTVLGTQKVAIPVPTGKLVRSLCVVDPQIRIDQYSLGGDLTIRDPKQPIPEGAAPAEILLQMAASDPVHLAWDPWQRAIAQLADDQGILLQGNPVPQASKELPWAGTLAILYIGRLLQITPWEAIQQTMLLPAAGFVINTCSTLAKALKLLQTYPYAAVLYDSGLYKARQIRDILGIQVPVPIPRSSWLPASMLREECRPRMPHTMAKTIAELVLQGRGATA